MAFTNKTTQKSPLWACGDKLKLLICHLPLQKKHTNPNQTSITPQANFYRQMLSYNINRPIIYYKKNMKKEAEKWKLIYIFFVFLYVLKVICNLDNVILTLPKTMTKNEKWLFFQKKKKKKKNWWNFKTMKNNEK